MLTSLNHSVVKNFGLMSGLISDNYRKDNTKVSEDYYKKKEYELFKIYYYALKNNDIKGCSKIVIDEFNDVVALSKKFVKRNNLPKKLHHGGPCIPGVTRLFLNADGFFYPCERVSETSKLTNIGHIDKGFDIESSRRILNIGKVNEEDCKNCWAISQCSVCIASLDNTEKEISKDKKRKVCAKMKLTIVEKFKDYCMLKEHDYAFNDNKIYLS